jgi:hypothetical protein
MLPSIPWQPSTHPTARQRFEYLLTTFSSILGEERPHWDDQCRVIDSMKPLLVKDISLNVEMYEFYGSVYLDKPNC